MVVTFKDKKELALEIRNNLKLLRRAFNIGNVNLEFKSVNQSYLEELAEIIINELLKENYIIKEDKRYIVNNMLKWESLASELYELGNSCLNEVDYFKTNGIEVIDEIILNNIRYNLNINKRNADIKNKHLQACSRKKAYEDEQAYIDASSAIFTFISCM